MNKRLQDQALGAQFLALITPPTKKNIQGVQECYPQKIAIPFLRRFYIHIHIIFFR